MLTCYNRYSHSNMTMWTKKGGRGGGVGGWKSFGGGGGGIKGSQQDHHFPFQRNQRIQMPPTQFSQCMDHIISPKNKGKQQKVTTPIDVSFPHSFSWKGKINLCENSSVRSCCKYYHSQWKLTKSMRENAIPLKLIRTTTKYFLPIHGDALFTLLEEFDLLHCTLFKFKFKGLGFVGADGENI